MNKKELLEIKKNIKIGQDDIIKILLDIVNSNINNKEELINILFEYPSDGMKYEKKLYYIQCLLGYLNIPNNIDIDESKINFKDVFENLSIILASINKSYIKHYTKQINSFKLKSNQEKFSKEFQLSTEYPDFNKLILIINEKKFIELINENYLIVSVIENNKYDLLNLNEDLKNNIKIMSFIVKNIKNTFNEDSIENREYYNNLLGDKLKKILNINEKSTVQNILNTIEKESTYINQKINQYKINKLNNKKEELKTISNEKVLLDIKNIEMYINDNDIKITLENIIKNINIINKSNGFGLHEYQVIELKKKIEKDIPFLLETTNKLLLVNETLGTDSSEIINIKKINVDKLNIELSNIAIEIKNNLNLEIQLKNHELKNNEIILDVNKMKLETIKMK